MTSYLLAGPGEEPVTLAEAKAWCRIDSDDEDALLSTLLAAARLHVESISGRALIAQTWRLALDAWPLSHVVRLPVTPLLSLEAIAAYDSDGVGTTISLAGIDAGRTQLLLPPDIESPALREHQAIEIDYVAGYGEDAAAVPADLKQALLLLVAYWFENRDAVIVAGAGGIVPAGFDRLVQQYRAVRL